MKMTKEEFRKLFKNKILLISVIAISFIPILYASIFDKSVWDPYGKAKDLPVAVVNEDQPVEMMGQKIDIGAQVVDNLKKNKGLDWKFVSKKQADKGMKDLKYFTVVTIPKDFSKNAASIIKKEPKKMEIIYSTNESLNYIANEIATVGITELEAQVREQVVAAYVEAVAQAGEKLIGGIEQAAEGAEEISGGTGQLKSGLTEYTNGVAQAFSGSGQLSNGLDELAGDIGPLRSGVNQLDTGANQLGSALNQINRSIAPVQSRIGTLDTGLIQLSNAARDLSTALSQFESHVDPQVMTALEHELNKIRQETQAIITNAGELQDISGAAYGLSNRIQAVSATISTIAMDVSAVQAGIDAEVTAIINQNTQIDEAIKWQLINELTTAVNHGLVDFESSVNAKLAGAVAELDALSEEAAVLAADAAGVGQVANAMAASANSVSASINNIHAGTQSLQQALNQVPNAAQAGNLVSGLNQVSRELSMAGNDLPKVLTGVNQLASGSSQLASGLDQMQAQMPTLASGVNQLDSGAGELSAGLAELNENSPKLLSGIDQLNSGASELSSALGSGASEAETIRITKKNIDQFAAPTKSIDKPYSKVANYGEALAPYIMSLALFVGCMLFNFVYPIRRVSMFGQSSDAWWQSKVILGLVVSSLMAFIQATVMLLIGLEVESVAQFYLTVFVSGWCYMAIIMFLAMTFDNPGRFVAMILLVLQLGGAGGTFPIQLQGTFFKVIHPWLPMSYSVYGLRNAITGGIGRPLYVKSLLILFILAVVFFLMLRFSMHILQQKHLDNISQLDDNQKLQAMLK